MREERLVRHHRVLVPPERREPVADERVERRLRLLAGDRPGELVERVGSPRVEPLADPRVSLAGEFVGVEPRRLGWFPAVRRRLLIEVVVVPLAADRLVAVHQHARLAADVAVPVLLSVASVGAPVLADDPVPSPPRPTHPSTHPSTHASRRASSRTARCPVAPTLRRARQRPRAVGRPRRGSRGA